MQNHAEEMRRTARVMREEAATPQAIVNGQVAYLHEVADGNDEIAEHIESLEAESAKLKHDLSQTEHDRLRRTHITLKEQRDHADRITRDTQALCAGLTKERDELKQQLAQMRAGRLGG